MKLLEEFLNKFSKIAIIALGNELKSDDAAGILVGKLLIEMKPPKTDIFITYQSPEAYIFKIVNGNYSHVIIVDAAELGADPGTIVIIDPDDIPQEVFSTHNVPLQFIINILEENRIKVLLVGIQRKLRSFGTKVSSEVKKACINVANAIYETIAKINFLTNRTE